MVVKRAVRLNKMFPLGIKYDPPYNTCLTTIKNVLPEIRSSDIVGDTRWSLALSLPEVYEVRNGDLLVWTKKSYIAFIHCISLWL